MVLRGSRQSLIPNRSPCLCQHSVLFWFIWNRDQLSCRVGARRGCSSFAQRRDAALLIAIGFALRPDAAHRARCIPPHRSAPRHEAASHYGPRLRMLAKSAALLWRLSFRLTRHAEPSRSRVHGLMPLRGCHLSHLGRAPVVRRRGCRPLVSRVPPSMSRTCSRSSGAIGRPWRVGVGAAAVIRVGTWEPGSSTSSAHFFHRRHSSGSASFRSRSRRAVVLEQTE